MTFTAHYRGVCSACGDHIEPGDEVAYDTDGGLNHVECPDVTGTHRELNSPVCPECWTTVSLSGACAC